MTAQRKTPRYRIAFIVALSFVAWPFLANAQGPTAQRDEQGADATARIRDLFRKGVASFKAKKYEEARTTLLEAWAIRPTSDVAAMLGQTEIHLRKNRDAAEHLDFCLRNVAAAESDQFLENVRKGFQKVKSQVGTLHVSVDREGAEIRLDGRAVGTSPLKQSLYVDPGEHVVEASLNGATGSDPVNAEAGKEFSAEITLGVPKPKSTSTQTIQNNPANTSTASTNAAVTPPPSSTSNIPPALLVSPEASHPSIVPVIVGGAVFAVGLAAGIGFRVASDSKYDDAKALRDKNGPDGCYGVTSSTCATQHDDSIKVDRYRNISTAGLIAAGVALVAVPIYWFWPRGSTKPAAIATKSIELHSGFDTRGANFGIKGEF